MRRGIRWIPARSSRLGQAVTAGNPLAPAAQPAQAVEKKWVSEKVVYGGLIVAGVALVVAWAMGTD